MVLLIPNGVSAWPCRVRLRAYRDALLWMPPIVRRLVRYWGPKPEPIVCPHTSHADGDTRDAIQTLQQYLDTVPVGMYEQRNLVVYLEMMPAAARILLDLRDPVRYAPSTPYAQAFYAYTMNHLREIPVLFYGYPDPLLERGSLKAWIRRAAEQTRSWSPAFQQPAAFGLPETPDAWPSLDFRSPAFAMAALNIQHAVTDIVRFWYVLWKKGHGSLRGLPAPTRPGIYRMRFHVLNTRRGR